MKFYSDRFALKYLCSDRGLCLGVELKDRSYLLLVSSEGLLVRQRPAGERVVEDLDHDITRIVRFLQADSVRVR